MTNQEYINKIRQNLLTERNTFSIQKSNGEYHLFLRVNVGQGEILYRKVLDTPPNIDNVLALSSYRDFAVISSDRTLYVPSGVAKDTDAVDYGLHVYNTREHLASTILPELYSRVIPKANLTEKEARLKENSSLYWARYLTLLNEPIEYLYSAMMTSSLYPFQSFSLYPHSEHDLFLLGEKDPETILRERFSKYKGKALDKLIFNEISELLKDDPNIVSNKERQLASAIRSSGQSFFRIFEEDPALSTTVPAKRLLSIIAEERPTSLFEQKVLTFNFTLKDENGDVVWSSNPKEQVVFTNMGRIPLVDYLEIQADKYGYDSYEALYNDGMRIAGYEDVSPDVFLTAQKNSL